MSWIFGSIGLILVTVGVYSVLAYSTTRRTEEIGIRLTLGRVIGTQLVGVNVYDPETLAATTFLLMMTAAIACWIPAPRAARVDPMVALRHP